MPAHGVARIFYFLVICRFSDCARKFESMKARDDFFIVSPWQDASGPAHQRFHVNGLFGCVKWKTLLIKARRDANAANLTASSSSIGMRKKNICSTCGAKFDPLEPLCVCHPSLWSQFTPQLQREVVWVVQQPRLQANLSGFRLHCN